MVAAAVPTREVPRKPRRWVLPFELFSAGFIKLLVVEVGGIIVRREAIKLYSLGRLLRNPNIVAGNLSELNRANFPPGSLVL